VWLVPVLAGSGVLLLGGVTLLILSRRKKRALAAASAQGASPIPAFAPIGAAQ
jgi:hypothetical protein